MNYNIDFNIVIIGISLIISSIIGGIFFLKAIKSIKIPEMKFEIKTERPIIPQEIYSNNLSIQDNLITMDSDELLANVHSGRFKSENNGEYISLHKEETIDKNNIDKSIEAMRTLKKK